MSAPTHEANGVQVIASQIVSIEHLIDSGSVDLRLADGRRVTVPSLAMQNLPASASHGLRDYYCTQCDGTGAAIITRAIFEAIYKRVLPAATSAADAAIEQEIQAKGLTKGPRLTPDDIEAAIAFECFFTAREGLAGAHAVIDGGECKVQVHRSPERLATVTICTLILRNGATVVGVNHGPVSPENFDAGLARKLARAKAVEQLWPLLGYALLEELHQIRMDLQQEQASDH